MVNAVDDYDVSSPIFQPDTSSRPQVADETDGTASVLGSFLHDADERADARHAPQQHSLAIGQSCSLPTGVPIRWFWSSTKTATRPRMHAGPEGTPLLDLMRT